MGCPTGGGDGKVLVTAVSCGGLPLGVDLSLWWWCIDNHACDDMNINVRYQRLALKPWEISGCTLQAPAAAACGLTGEATTAQVAKASVLSTVTAFHIGSYGSHSLSHCSVCSVLSQGP